MAELLGVPESEVPTLQRMHQTILGVLSAKPDFGDYDRYFTELAEERRRDPQDDLLSLLTQAEVDGKKLDRSEILGWVDLLITGGIDTTHAAAAGGLLALIEHRDQLARLQQDLSLLESAVEEILRWTSPLVHFARTATADTELSGQKIRKGDVVALLYPSANRDEEHFEDPYRFRIDRSPNRHLAFGVGEHVCPGAHLARLELQRLFAHLLPRLVEVELAGPVEHAEANVISGLKRLPVRFHFEE